MMASDLGRIILRNNLVGRWCAEKLGMVGDNATAYADDISARAMENGGDVFSVVRSDLDAGGLAYSDQDIGEAITRCTIQAGNLLKQPRGGSSDAAAITLIRKLTSR